jgi:hypothetical protein
MPPSPASRYPQAGRELPTAGRRPGHPDLMRTLPDAVLRRTRQQHGLVTRAQLLAIAASVGLTGRAVDGWITRGHLERVHPGVYRLAGCPPTHQQAALAKVLRAGEGARADGELTLALLGIEGFDLARPPAGCSCPPAGASSGRPSPSARRACRGAIWRQSLASPLSRPRAGWWSTRVGTRASPGGSASTTSAGAGRPTRSDSASAPSRSCRTPAPSPA